MAVSWVNRPFVIGGPTAQQMLATVCVAGLQFAWGIEQAYVTATLLELGMSKPSLSLVWIAGPLSGLLVQPIVGVISDKVRFQAGRRRPFILSSTAVITAALVAFAWADGLASWLNVSPLTIATAAVLIMDVGVNVYGACSRALIVDVFSIKEQKITNAWAGRMSAVGHLGSYFLGSLNMTRLGFPTQLKGVVCVSSFMLIAATLITCVSIQERQLISYYRPGMWSSLKNLFGQLTHTACHLDRQLAAIFRVQLFGWYAWFTFLFYGAAWAGEVWRAENDGNSGDQARAGARALLAFSVFSTLFSFLLPLIPTKITRLWAISYVAYALGAFATGFIHKYTSVLLFFSVAGFPWAMVQWAPFALTAQRIHELPPASQVDPDVRSIETQLTVDSSDTVLSDPYNLTAEKAGLYLGLHNAAISFPQLISTLGSYLVFKFSVGDSDPTNDGGYAIAVSLQVGSIFAILAAYFAWRVRTDISGYQILRSS